MKRYSAFLVCFAFLAVVLLTVFYPSEPIPEIQVERWDVYAAEDPPMCVQCKTGETPESDQPLTLIAKDVSQDEAWRAYMTYRSPMPVNGFTAGPKAGAAR